MLHIYRRGALRLRPMARRMPFAGYPKTLSIFAYLPLHRRQPLERERLAFTFWLDVAVFERLSAGAMR